MAFLILRYFETDETRFGTIDIVTQFIMKGINWALPSIYKSIHVNDISHAMVAHATKYSTSASTEQVLYEMYYDEMMKFKEPDKRNQTGL